MKQHKPGKRTSRLMGSALLLTLIFCISILVVSTGSTFARYRAERREEITVQVRKSGELLIGTADNNGFTETDRLEWKTADRVAWLQFAIANGTGETSYYAEDQAVKLCMLGTLGIAKEGVPPELSVSFMSPEENGEKTVRAVASPIAEGTALYHSYGEGWLYRFYEEDGGQELTWELSGSSWSVITLMVSMQGELPEGVNLLQPLLSTTPVSD